MTLKESIQIEQQIKNPLLMEVNFLKIYDRLSPNDKKRVNAAVTNVITSKFEPKFGKYLNDKLYNMSRKVELLQVLKDIESGDENLKERLYTTIGTIVMDYYENIIKTKILKRSISGDRNIDRVFERMVSRAFDSDVVHEALIKNIQYILDAKFRSVFSDDDYQEMVTEGVLDRAKDKASEFIDKRFGGRESKLRWKVINRVLAIIPTVNYELKKAIKDFLYSKEYKVLISLDNHFTGANVSQAITIPILRFLVKNSLDKFTINGDPLLVQFGYALNHISNDASIATYFRSELTDYLRKINASKTNTNKR